MIYAIHQLRSWHKYTGGAVSIHLILNISLLAFEIKIGILVQWEENVTTEFKEEGRRGPSHGQQSSGEHYYIFMILYKHQPIALL